MTVPRESPPDRTGFAEEYPFESHFLPVSGGRLHYVDEGRGEVLLCVHGNPTWSFAWRNVIRRFRDRYRVIALDHLGCGFSSKPQAYPYRLANHIANLQTLIDHLQLRQITLVAHDWGGAIGMGAAGQRPELFSQLILMNTGAFRSQAIPWRIAVCRWPLLGPLGVRGFNLFARAALSMAVEHREKLTPAIRRGLLAPYGNWQDRVAIQRFVEDIPLNPSHPSYATLVDVESGLQRLQGHPLLLIWGERDWCFTPAFREEFQRRFPQAEALP
ncbi:MAG: alpha/beta fold hydrolase, partial [Planctomycetaceae bacterium]